MGRSIAYLVSLVLAAWKPSVSMRLSALWGKAATGAVIQGRWADDILDEGQVSAVGSKLAELCTYCPAYIYGTFDHLRVCSRICSK
jgi:hypothetical protein